MSGLSELIAKLEGLSGPDREVDLALARELVPDVIVLLHDKESGKNLPHTYWEYTGSIDAAVALVERKLPGWGYYLRSDKEGHGCGLVYPDAFRVTPCHCMGSTPAIAVCLALLCSLEGRDE